MIKSASQIYKEFQPTLDGQEAIEPEEWMVMAFKAYAEQALELASEEAEVNVKSDFNPIGRDTRNYLISFSAEERLEICASKNSILNLKQQLK